MKVYSEKQYYTKGNSVYRNRNRITTFSTDMEAQAHAWELNRQHGDLGAYGLLNALRDEMSLYEDGEEHAETILNSLIGMLDSRQINLDK